MSTSSDGIGIAIEDVDSGERDTDHDSGDETYSREERARVTQAAVYEYCLWQNSEFDQPCAGDAQMRVVMESVQCFQVLTKMDDFML